MLCKHNLISMQMMKQTNCFTQYSATSNLRHVILYVYVGVHTHTRIHLHHTPTCVQMQNIFSPPVHLWLIQCEFYLLMYFVLINFHIWLSNIVHASLSPRNLHVHVQMNEQMYCTTCTTCVCTCTDELADLHVYVYAMCTHATRLKR